ncbi:MerR family transcriptional regulator [Schlegelella sp. ID0723]|uniref:MerR family transcriptional regulator n=2 Tax=Piscinibacter koreensis TaxID=2742824 RepID=A0A7Y6TY99_9BURK|nr:MerR family transcriptional regulator [Schlegelella koreensis]
MLQMPGATLRIWERRYNVAAPATTSSGHRQYSAADVQRLALIRQLTLVGHRIGSLASLDLERLRDVASTHAAALTHAPARAHRTGAACKLAVVGRGAEHRVERSEVQLRADRAVHVAAAFGSLRAARRHAAAARHDLLLVFADGLQASMLADVQAAAKALRARHTAIAYSFAPGSVTRAFAACGISLIREPLDDASLGDFLSRVVATRSRQSASAASGSPAAPPVAITLGSEAPRRYDDAALADFAGLSTTIACECPRHLAEIIQKLSHFEAYSAQCEHLDASDAALHSYLGRITATARSIFESALEHVAVREGLVVPQR